MRILHVNSRYWPYAGGAERHLQEICERQAREGHEVTVYTTDAYDLELFWSPDARRVPERSGLHNGVRIVRFRVEHVPPVRFSFSAIRRGLVALSLTRLAPVWLLRTIAPLAPYVPSLQQHFQTTNERFDVVHGMNICFEGLLWPACEFARRTGAAFCVTPITHLGEGRMSLIRQYYTMRHQIALEASSDCVLSQTDIETAYLARRGVPRTLLIHAGAGVNPDDLAGGDAPRFRANHSIHVPFATYIGAAAFDKGTEHLILAMEQLWGKGERADLVLAGPRLSTFDRFLAGRPSETRRRCHILGVVTEEEKRDLLAACSLLAMPSRTDSLGLVYLEAWYYGKPVIGARAGGVPAVISDGDDGLLVRFGDVAAIAAAISRLLHDEPYAHLLGQRGQQKTISEYTWDVVYPRIRSAYDHLPSRLVPVTPEPPID